MNSCKPETCEVVRKWTYKEIISLCGTIGLAFIIFVMMFLRVSELYEHEKEDWKIDRQREDEVIERLEVIEHRILEVLNGDKKVAE